MRVAIGQKSRKMTWEGGGGHKWSHCACKPEKSNFCYGYECPEGFVNIFEDLKNLSGCPTPKEKVVPVSKKISQVMTLNPLFFNTLNCTLRMKYSSCTKNIETSLTAKIELNRSAPE